MTRVKMSILYYKAGSPYIIIRMAIGEEYFYPTPKVCAPENNVFLVAVACRADCWTTILSLPFSSGSRKDECCHYRQASKVNLS